MNDKIQYKFLKDKKQSIFLFILVWLIYTFVYLSKSCFAAAMADIVNKGVLTKTQTGTISAVFYISYAIFQIVGGFASDKYSPNKLLTIGLIGAAICNLSIYFVHSYIAILVIWTLNGMVQFGVWPSVFKIVSQQLCPELRYTGAYYITTASILGVVLSYLLAAIVTDWKNNFLVAGSILAVSAGAWLLLYHLLEKNMVVEQVKKNVTKADTKQANLLKLMFVSGLAALIPVCILHTALINGIKTFLPLMVMESYNGVSVKFVTAVNMIPSFLCLLGLPVTSLFYPRHIRNESLMLAVLYIPSTILACVFLGLGKINMFAVYACIFVAIILLTGATQFVTSLLAVRFERYGCAATVSGIINAAASLGMVIMNFGTAYIADKFGWNTTVYVILLLFVTVIAFCLATVKRWGNFIKR